MNVILSGASGWIGQRIAEIDPDSLIPLTRNAASTDKPQLVADLASESSLESLATQYAKLPPAQAFIHCAGLAHQPLETEAVKAEMWRVNDQGTAHALEFCKRVGIKRFVYVSTIAGYDWSNNHPARETDQIHPKTAYAQSKLKAEERVLQSELDARVVRLATVFGTGDAANLAKLCHAIRSKRFFIPGKGTARKSVIPVDLAAALILQYARLDTPAHKLINLALPQAPTLKEICQAFASQCQLPQPPSLPLPLAKTAAFAGDLISRIRPFPFNTSTLGKLITSTEVDTTRMTETFPKQDFPSFCESLSSHSEYYRNHRP